MSDDGSVAWTSPTGHVYVRPAQSYPVGVIDPRPPRPAEPGKPDPPLPRDDPPF